MTLLTLIGMGTGLSKAIAHRFGKEGFAVAMIARNADKLTEFEPSFAAEGITARGFAADIGDLQNLDAALTRIKAEMGSSNVLVYNAAAYNGIPPRELTAERLISDFTVNVASALHATHAVLPDMVARHQGTILFTGGGLALYPNAAYMSLSIGKAGIRSLALTLADAVKDDGVHVATVTIKGFMNPNDPKYAPVIIAEQYWALHEQPRDAFEAEIIY